MATAKDTAASAEKELSKNILNKIAGSNITEALDIEKNRKKNIRIALETLTAATKGVQCDGANLQYMDDNELTAAIGSVARRTADVEAAQAIVGAAFETPAYQPQSGDATGEKLIQGFRFELFRRRLVAAQNMDDSEAAQLLIDAILAA